MRWQRVVRLDRERAAQLPGRYGEHDCGEGDEHADLWQDGDEVAAVFVDKSLVFAQQAAAEAGLDITFLQGDMRALTFEAEFDVVVNLVSSFGYADDPAARSGLDPDAIQPPIGGRAPGWDAGLVLAHRQMLGAQAGPRPIAPTAHQLPGGAS
jgi:SAM-dependent methyltransferase